MIVKLDKERTVLCYMPDGSYKKMLLKDVKSNPIIHKEISKERIQKIDDLYYSMMGLTNEGGLNLEKFEIGFMRVYNIDEWINKWEIVCNIFHKYIDNYETKTKHETALILPLAHLLVMEYDFPEQDKKDIMLQRIIEIYNEIKSYGY